MACAGLDASTLASLVAQAKIVLRVEDDDATYATSALAIYHDESASATAATVAYSTATNTLTLTITDGANAGSYTYDTSGTANDTLTELVANINAEAVGFVATLVGEATSRRDCAGASCRPPTPKCTSALATEHWCSRSRR
jgi:hypothetical protein